MYKKLTFEQICNTKTKFFDNLQSLYKSQHYVYLKDFIKKIFIDGESLYFLESNEIVFKLSKIGSEITFCDEREKIELTLDEAGINQMHNLLKDQKKVTNIKSSNMTILESLIEEFISNESMSIILDKPFIVYDIETVGNINNLRSMQFMMGYSFMSTDNHKEGLKFKYIEKDNLNKFVDFLINFDGRIIGYNNIYFDNPVSIYASGVEEEKIKLLNQKSIDLFVFIWNLTGKRMGLNKVCTSLISLGKTLESGKEGDDLLREYIKTGDVKLLTKVKNYCRNDVKMTVGLLLYLMKYLNLYIDGEDLSYSIEEFVTLASKERSKEEGKKEKVSNQSIFTLI